MAPMQLVRLGPLMARTQGRPEIALALIDGPVVLELADLSGARIRKIAGSPGGSCTRLESVACMHATFVAGMLVARRGSVAPAICPGCTLILRPIFAESTEGNGQMPSAKPQELAKAIVEAVDAGAGVINLSAALAQPTSHGDRQLGEALDYSASRGVIVVAAAGNQATVGSSAITRHPWVIPVVACDREGKPTVESNLGSSIGRRGLRAPGQEIISLGTDGAPLTSGGTSAAAPFVSGAIALLWSEFPGARAAEVKSAITRCGRQLPNTIVPPLLDAWGAYQIMASAQSGSNGS
jgi:subtilisin family serine protease